MSKILKSTYRIAMAAFLCVSVMACSPLRGLIYTDVKEPGVAPIVAGGFFGGGNASALATYSVEDGKGPGSKVGKVTVKNVLGLFAWGDASVEGAAKAGGITTIHTVDSEVYRFWLWLPWYMTWTTVVTGE